MAYPKEKKTKQEWDKIKWENNLGVQIGACVNKAVDLTIAHAELVSKGLNRGEIEEEIKDWVDILYKIGTEKKSQILKDQEPKPLTKEQIEEANKRGKKILEQENQEQGAGIDAVNDQLNAEAAQNKDNIPF